MCRSVTLFLCAAAACLAQKPPAPPPVESPKPVESEAARRTELNLLGKADTAAGESRRNENIFFNLVDNNALKELNIRLGTTATIIEQFRAERGYFSSEFGNPPSLVLKLAPQKASALHGTLQASHLNSIFSARTFFQVGGVKPARENDYGFNVASPLGARTWFAAEASQQKIRGVVNGNVLVPRPDERTPLTNSPARDFIARLLNAYPLALPNRTDINERALNTNARQSIDNHNAALRLDRQLSTRDRLYTRYLFTYQHVEAFQLVSGQNPNTDTRAHTARLTWSRTWSPATTMDVSAGFDRIGSLLVSDKTAVGPMVATSGLTTLGPEAGIPINRAQNLFRYGWQLRTVRGAHTLTWGALANRRQFNGIESDTHRGYFSFAFDFGRDAITNLRLGLPSQYIRALGEIHRGFRNWDLQFYAGDEWKLSGSLTLSAGLRYQPAPAPNEVNALDRIPYACDCNNAAPRLGLAWRAPGRWGVLRAAYGFDYGEIFPVTFQQVRFAPPRNQKIVVPTPDLLNPLGSFNQAGGAPAARPTTYVLDDRLIAPYAQQYNISWEPDWSKTWRLQFGYVGSRSQKLLLMWYTNRAQAVPGIPQTTATINDRRADPRFAEIRRVINGSRGYYDAARVSLIVPRWHGLSASAAYWFSKALDLGSGYTNTAYDADSRQSRSQSEFLASSDMRGRSNFDQPHALLSQLTYALPAPSGSSRWARGAFANWSFSTVALVKQGTPFTIVSGSDAPGFGNVDANGNDRPNLLDTAILGRTIGNPDTSRALLPRGAFAYIRPTDARGNLGRNTFRRGPIRNVNAALSKEWRFSQERRLRFRAESINFLNTPQFAEPGLELASPNFGQITNTLNDGRTFRFSLQLGF